MRARFGRSVIAVAGALVLAVPPASAQEKAAPKVLSLTSSSDAAKSALADALVEVQNIGGGSRFDAKLKRVIEADPHFALGRAYYANWTSTLSAAERTKEMDQAMKDAVNASTPELLVVAAIREARAGRLPLSRDLLDVALEQAPDDQGVHFLRLMLAADANEGVRIGEKVVQQFPDFGPAYNLLAYRLQAVGRPADAIAMVQKYVALMPSHPNSYDSYAELLSLQGKLDESDAQYKKAVDVDPGYEVGYEGLAENAFRRGDFAGARPQVEKSFDKAATPARRIVLLRELATLYLLDNQMTEAKRQLARALDIAAATSMAASAEADHRNLALLVALEGKRTQAQEEYDAGKPTTPTPFQPMFDAVFYTVMGQPAKVIEAEPAMIRNATESPDVAAVQDAMHLGQLLAALARKDVADARAHQGSIKAPLYRAWGGAFLVKPLKDVRDNVGTQAALADIDAYKDLNLNAAFVRLVAKRR